MRKNCNLQSVVLKIVERVIWMGVMRCNTWYMMHLEFCRFMPMIWALMMTPCYIVGRSTYVAVSHGLAHWWLTRMTNPHSWHWVWVTQARKARLPTFVLNAPVGWPQEKFELGTCGGNSSSLSHWTNPMDCHPYSLVISSYLSFWCTHFILVFKPNPNNDRVGTKVQIPKSYSWPSPLSMDLFSLFSTRTHTVVILCASFRICFRSAASVWLLYVVLCTSLLCTFLQLLTCIYVYYVIYVYIRTINLYTHIHGC